MPSNCYDDERLSCSTLAESTDLHPPKTPVDTNPPTPQAGRPKRLADLPNEVIARICEYLVPDWSKPQPFKEDEIKASMCIAVVDGWSKFAFIAGNEPDTQDCVSHHTSLNRYPPDEMILLEVLSKPMRSKNRWATVLLASQPPADDSAAKHGHCLRDASPHQTFSVIPDDQGSIRPSWAMIDPKVLTIVKVPRTRIPGNVAYGAFSSIFKSLHTLHIHVNLDMDHEAHSKTKFFLGQIGRYILSHPRGEISLSTLDVTVYLGFHESATPDDTDPQFPYLAVPYNLLQRASVSGSQPVSIANIVLQDISTVLGTLTTYLQQFRAKQNGGRGGSGRTESEENRLLTIRLFIHGNGTPGMQWGQKIPVTTRAAPGYAVLAKTVDFGSFEDFCKGLQQRLYGPGQTAANRLVDKIRCICELGLPVPKEPTALGKGKTKGFRSTQHAECGSDSELDVKEPKRRRVG